jgi:hypothetical protein
MNDSKFEQYVLIYAEMTNYTVDAVLQFHINEVYQLMRGEL